jgi:phosphate transport system protein
MCARIPRAGVVGCRVSLGKVVARIVAFVRAGYPRGLPRTNYLPLLALLRRRLSDDEVAAVAKTLAGRRELNIETADIGAAITRITDELPSSADVDRVQYKLVLQVKIEALTRSIADMCGLAGTAMQQATQALLQADVGMAETVIRDHANLVARAAQTESDAFSVLALQAPIAADLRTVLSCVKNIADIGRMGALALHVAKITRRRHPAHALPEEVNGYFAEMGRIAVNIGHEAKDVVLTADPDKAAKLAEDDDAMDALHRHLFTVLMDQHWPHPIATAVDVTLLSRYYERFADHAVEIGQRTLGQATGATTA